MPASTATAPESGGGELELALCVGMSDGGAEVVVGVGVGRATDVPIEADEPTEADEPVAEPWPPTSEPVQPVRATTPTNETITIERTRTSCPNYPVWVTSSASPLLQIGSASDVGCIRDHNEDALLADPPVFVVADGMGGHAAGEVASALAIAQFAALAGRYDVGPDELVACVAAANDTVLQAGVDDPAAEGLGTTISGAVLSTLDGELQWVIVNVGDSRAYLRRDGQLSRRTIDHSEVEEMVLAGYLTAAEARVHPRRNVVTRSIGTIPPPEPDVWTVPALSGDQLVVCSDGLTNEIDDAELELLLGSGAQPQDIADALVERARIAGGHDNITVIVAELK
jgi:protein phosphatase